MTPNTPVIVGALLVTTFAGGMLARFDASAEWAFVRSEWPSGPAPLAAPLGRSSAFCRHTPFRHIGNRFAS